MTFKVNQPPFSSGTHKTLTQKFLCFEFGPWSMIFVAVDPPMNGSGKKATQDFKKGYLSSGSPNKRINVVFCFKKWIQCSHGTTPKKEVGFWLNSSYVHFIIYLFIEVVVSTHLKK